MTEPTSHLRKAQGLLLGSALGDALGSPSLGHDAVDPTHLAVRERSLSPLHCSDITVQTYVLADHLVQQRESAPCWTHDLARRLARARRAPRGNGHDNRAAVRASPISLVSTSLIDAAELARRSARLTHNHPHGHQGAALHASAALLALHSEPKWPVDREQFLDLLRYAVTDGGWHTQLDRIRLLAPSTPPADAATKLGADTSAITSVPLAIHAFLCHPDDPATAIRYAIHAGGDTGTTAAMTGALAGARTGLEALPTVWLKRLHRADRLTNLATALAVKRVSA